MVDRRFLNFHITIKKIANFPDSGYVAGDQYIVGATPSSEFMNAKPNDIAVYNGSKWEFIPPQTTTSEVINLNNGDVLHFNGTAWIQTYSLQKTSYIIEEHELTAEEIEEYQITLEHDIRTDFENETMIFFSGIVLLYNTDFYLAYNTRNVIDFYVFEPRISFIPGDKLTIRYVRA